MLNATSYTATCIAHIKPQNTRMSMIGQHHCTLAFEGTLFSHGRTQKFFFASPATFSSNEAIVCIRSTDNDGKIAGYIKFDSAPDGVEERSSSLWGAFQKSVVLNGLELETSRNPELSKVTPDGKQIKRITAMYRFAYNINIRTTKIDKNKIQKNRGGIRKFAP